MEPLDLDEIKKESEPWVNDRIEGPRAREALALITIIEALVVALEDRSCDGSHDEDSAWFSSSIPCRSCERRAAALALVRRG